MAFSTEEILEEFAEVARLGHEWMNAGEFQVRATSAPVNRARSSQVDRARKLAIAKKYREALKNDPVRYERHREQVRAGQVRFRAKLLATPGGRELRNALSRESMRRYRERLKTGAPVKTRPLQATCEKGHALAGENLYVRPTGHRECRACRALRARKTYERKRAKAPPTLPAPSSPAS
jgi:hypothetical protein